MWPSGAGRLSAGCGSPSQRAEAFPEPSPRPCTAGPGQGTRLGHMVPACCHVALVHTHSRPSGVRACTVLSRADESPALPPSQV